METIYFWKHWYEWAIVAFCLLGLIYTLIVIKEENASFRDSAIPINFHQFRFLIPSWWLLTEEDSHQYSFKRRDSHHDWKASLYWFDNSSDSLSLIERGRSFMREKGIQFDFGHGFVKNPKARFEGRSSRSNDKVEMVRIEGAATKAGIERKYIDIFVAKIRKQEGHLLAVSECGILDGPLEGPYFEEVMFRSVYLPGEA